MKHKIFELHCDNLALCSLLRRTKDVGRLGIWILRLAPFKFTVKHTRGVGNVADALSRLFDGKTEVSRNVLFSVVGISASGVVLIVTPEEFPFCKQIRHKVFVGDEVGAKFQLQWERLCYYTKGAKRLSWVVPVLTRPKGFKVFPRFSLLGSFWSAITFQKVVAHFWWPKMQAEVFRYVKKHIFCQRAKSAQTTQVGLHSGNLSSRPMERLFIDFVGPLIRTKRGNIAIMVIVDGFSKFLTFHTVRRISGSVVEYLERMYFPAMGPPFPL